MRTALSTLSLVLLLAACAPQTGSDTSSSSSPKDRGTVVSIALQKSSETNEADGVVHTTATLQLGGALEETVDLGDIQGELFVVENANDNDADVVAMLTAWFAGQGEEIIITHADDKLTVSHIYGDESGFCTEPETIAEFELSDRMSVELLGFDETVEQSSLAFCKADRE